MQNRHYNIDSTEMGQLLICPPNTFLCLHMYDIVTFKVTHPGQNIEFALFEFHDLDYVSIDTKINSVAQIQANIQIM